MSVDFRIGDTKRRVRRRRAGEAAGRECSGRSRWWDVLLCEKGESEVKFRCRGMVGWHGTAGITPFG
jgi:hypothetical protein